ncbi:hypothetical protein DSECCO2_518800 [anaerobic digester metagenome]
MTAVRANACLHVPAGTGKILPGTEIDVLLTGPRTLIQEAAELAEPAPDRSVRQERSGAPFC